MLNDPELLWCLTGLAGFTSSPSSHSGLLAMFIHLSWGKAARGEGWSLFLILLGKVGWEKGYRSWLIEGFEIFSKF